MERSLTLGWRPCIESLGVSAPAAVGLSSIVTRTTCEGLRSVGTRQISLAWVGTWEYLRFGSPPVAVHVFLAARSHRRCTANAEDPVIHLANPIRQENLPSWFMPSLRLSHTAENCSVVLQSLHSHRRIKCFELVNCDAGQKVKSAPKNQGTSAWTLDTQ